VGLQVGDALVMLDWFWLLGIEAVRKGVVELWW
jgi:hypothetical protein